MAFTVISYSKGISEKYKGISVEDASKLPGTVWINWVNPTRKDLNELKKHYGFHSLALDDCTHTVQRSKVEEFDGYLFLVARSISYENGVVSHQISAFVGKDYVITVHKEEFSFLKDISKLIMDKNQSILSRGPDFLLYTVLDRIIDGYFEILDTIEDKIEKVETEVIKRSTKATIQRIFKLKKDLLLLRKPIWPLREVLNAFRAGQLPNVNEETLPYFRDLYDHIIQVIDLVETYRELISGSMDIYISSVSNAMNEVMKVLTVIASLMLVPMLITGIYGMNFRYMPELNWTYGYPFALSLMGLTILLMGYYFRREGWV